ncbi:hypothetical protein FHL15_001766 [Xylaria flabelliformis]|uniref:Uncharacterized protein n=1 Tax=Xylaria flabelliformis TaxID=2512241 RepID=A0A553IBB3_9PEZI|nr:hypothetical protein FHL15_001766 [Xylaria flabelliformis]
MPRVYSAFNLDDETALLARFPPMIRTIGRDTEMVLDLPYLINPSDSSPTNIVITDRHKLNSLPEEDCKTLRKVQSTGPRYYRTYVSPFETPIRDEFFRLANPATRAHCALTSANYKIQRDNGKRTECAGYSEKDTLYSDGLLGLLFEGESWNTPCGVTWYATGFLEPHSTCDYAAIITTYTREDLTHKRILRSELLTLLCLLQVAGTRAVKNHESSMSPTVFLLSFVYGQARVIEARIEAPDRVAVFIRQLSDKVPAMEERDEMLNGLISWAMFVDGDDEYYSSVSGQSDISIEVATTVNNDDTDGTDDSDDSYDSDDSDNSDDTGLTQYSDF